MAPPKESPPATSSTLLLPSALPTHSTCDIRHSSDSDYRAREGSLSTLASAKRSSASSISDCEQAPSPPQEKEGASKPRRGRFHAIRSSMSTIVDMAAPTISRTQTMPMAARNPSTSTGAFPGTMSSRSSQLTSTSSFSSSSLTPTSSMSSSTTLVATPAAGNVMATNNIINQRADASRSLYQICVNLRQRLAQVPGFDVHLTNSDNEDEESQEERDPVSSLWRCLRKGYPLMTIYNALQPPTALTIDEATQPETKKPKIAAFKFVQACLMDLHLPPGECFVISDLFGDDTTGFVKVTQVINVVLDVAEQRGLLNTANEADSALGGESVAGETKMSQRDHVVSELVNTERKYVQDLENLHELKKKIEQKGVIPGDVVHDIFLNINAILDFQRRFLIKIETTNSMPEASQQWGIPFVNYEDAFGIYQPFIANQRKAATIAKREFDKISMADHPVVVDFNTLDGFLLKPMQRLVKYPLLLKELVKASTDDETRQDLTAGIEASNRVLHQANAAVDRELRAEALAELCTRVDDWKNHQVDQFGELLLHGQFTVVTGKSDMEKEYTIYLFERILLCCKELNPNKSKDKFAGAQKDKKDKKDKEKKDKKDKSKSNKLQLKGRIFMTNVTEVVSLGKPGSYTVQIWWKGDPGVENFIIRFNNDDTMKKWSTGIDAQRKKYTDTGSAPTSGDSSNVDFAWMRDHAMPINPYKEQDDDDDDDFPTPSTASTATAVFPGNMPRNSSASSLRSRSATGESSQFLASIARGPPPRFPMALQNPPLSVQTQLQPQVPSPGARVGGDSYFSPVAESPVSSRTSTTSGTYPFPRQGTPQGWQEYGRYTAPAEPRGPSRDGTNPAGANSAGYQMNGRTPQRPSLPVMASNNSQNGTQRSRSYSSPNINDANGNPRRAPNGTPVPAVPGIPAHLHPAYDAGIPRSNSNSPSNGQPVRSNTQSPGAQRERMNQQAHPNGPTQHARSHPTPAPINAYADSAVSGTDDMPLPTQLKVKCNCDGNYVTLVVSFNISYQSLVDRIDAKIGRFSPNAIARGTMRLRYRDEDGDFVTIESDEDIQIAFQEWREQQKQQDNMGQLGEIELFCLSTDGGSGN